MYRSFFLLLGLCFSSKAFAQATSLPTSQPCNELNAPLDLSFKTQSLEEVSFEAKSQPTSQTKEQKTPLSFGGRKRPWTVAILPVPVASSDLGIGGAVQVSVYDHHKEIIPYNALYEFFALYSSNGVQAYLGTLDRPALWDGKYRLKAQIAYINDPNQYYGLGNETVRDPEVEATGFNANTFRVYGTAISLRRKLIGSLQLVGAIDSRRYFVDVLPGTLLLEERPSGFEGNLVTQLGIALYRDTRDNEVWTSKGSFYELSLHGAPPELNKHPFLGASFIARHYKTFGPGITLAERFVLDGLFGDAPFTIQDKFGLDGTYSLGGGRSLRGYPESRYIGKVKTLVNLEARFLPLTAKIKGLRFDLGAAAFVDAGRVLEDINTPLNGLNLHIGAGAGLRVLYERDFLVRVDMAHSNEDAIRFYLDIGHIF